MMNVLGVNVSIVIIIIIIIIIVIVRTQLFACMKSILDVDSTYTTLIPTLGVIAFNHMITDILSNAARNSEMSKIDSLDVGGYFRYRFLVRGREGRGKNRDKVQRRLRVSKGDGKGERK